MFFGEKPQEKNKDLNAEIQFEKCVNCGAVTDVPCDLAIEKRNYYVSGSGQLCPNCFVEIYCSSDSSLEPDIVSVISQPKNM